MTKGSVAKIVGVALMLSTTTTATAQWRTKDKSKDSLAYSSDEAARAFQLYARCVADKRYDRARSIALAPYASPEQAAAVSKIIRPDEDNCLVAGVEDLRMRFDRPVLAGGIAQALVLKEYPDLPAVVARFKLDPIDENARLAKLNAAEVYARCIVQRDPASVLALFASRPGTAQERQAIAGLNDDLGPCLKAGSTLKINAMFLRNTSGIAAYRLAQQIEARGKAAATSK